MGVANGMAKVMHDIILDSTKNFVVSFIDVFVDEVMTIDNTKWLFIHLYVVQLWKRILILFCVQTMGMSTTFDNIFFLMLKCLVEYGGLRLGLINNGCNGNNVLQGLKLGVTLQFKEEVALFVTRVHCFIYKTNLVVITLSSVFLVHQLEVLLQRLYAFFVHNPKKFYLLICCKPRATNCFVT